ncbi:MAG: hypothetical protein V4507_02755 [Verrucomicrobiota bacterium]
MNIPWMMVKRTNGQAFYFNMNQVGMVFENPGEAEVLVYGNGWEKKFRPDEAKEFMEMIKAQTAAQAALQTPSS